MKNIHTIFGLMIISPTVFAGTFSALEGTYQEGSKINSPVCPQRVTIQPSKGCHGVEVLSDWRDGAQQGEKICNINQGQDPRDFAIYIENTKVLWVGVESQESGRTHSSHIFYQLVNSNELKTMTVQMSSKQKPSSIVCQYVKTKEKLAK